jgi:hypothetical protein
MTLSELQSSHSSETENYYELCVGYNAEESRCDLFQHSPGRMKKTIKSTGNNTIKFSDKTK